MVTGGARGIGAGIARAMVAEGAKVVIGDVLDREGEALATELGASATYVHLDVTDPDEWEAASGDRGEDLRRAQRSGEQRRHRGLAPIEQYSRADWDRIIAINLTGVFNGIQAAIPALKAARGGSIVNISSIAGLARRSRNAGLRRDEVRPCVV